MNNEETKTKQIKHKCLNCGTEYEAMMPVTIYSPMDYEQGDQNNRCPNCGRYFLADMRKIYVQGKFRKPDEWFNMATNLYEIILVEFAEVMGGKNLDTIYPKLIIMYQFFRLLRGEAFNSVRPHGLGDLQKDIYRMEDEIAKRLGELEKQLNPRDESVIYYLNLMKKQFDLTSEEK